MAERPPTGNARPVRLRDVARLAGVDISTASRALTGQRQVREETRQRVAEAVASLRYSPNQAARNLRLSRSMTLGVVIHTFDQPIYLDALEGMGAMAGEAGYHLLITSARGDAGVYAHLMQQLFERRVDGLILWAPPPLADALGPFTDLSIPVLVIGHRAPDSPPLPHIHASESAGVEAGLQRLAALGHRSLVYINAPESRGRNRLPLLQQTAASYGLALAHTTVTAGLGVPGLCALLQRRLTGRDGATALLSDHHHLARVATALHMLGLRAPNDVSLLTFARSRWAQSMWEPIAAIETDAVAFGRQVARRMVEWLAGTAPPPDTAAAVSAWVERATIGPARPAPDSCGPPTAGAPA